MREFEWDCRNGLFCFNKTHRLDFRPFKPHLPRNISPTDIDHSVDVNGYFLLIEVKSHGSGTTQGQEEHFVNWTKLSTKVAGLIVYGDANPLDVKEVRYVWDGYVHPPVATTTDDFWVIYSAWGSSPPDAIRRYWPENPWKKLRIIV